MDGGRKCFSFSHLSFTLYSPAILSLFLVHLPRSGAGVRLIYMTRRPRQPQDVPMPAPSRAQPQRTMQSLESRLATFALAETQQAPLAAGTTSSANEMQHPTTDQRMDID